MIWNVKRRWNKQVSPYCTIACGFPEAWKEQGRAHMASQMSAVKVGGLLLFSKCQTWHVRQEQSWLGWWTWGHAHGDTCSLLGDFARQLRLIYGCFLGQKDPAQVGTGTGTSPGPRGCIHVVWYVATWPRAELIEEICLLLLAALTGCPYVK